MRNKVEEEEEYQQDKEENNENQQRKKEGKVVEGNSNDEEAGEGPHESIPIQNGPGGRKKCRKEMQMHIGASFRAIYPKVAVERAKNLQSDKKTIATEKYREFRLDQTKVREQHESTPFCTEIKGIRQYDDLLSADLRNLDPQLHYTTYVHRGRVPSSLGKQNTASKDLFQQVHHIQMLTTAHTAQGTSLYKAIEPVDELV
jgi:hypothetical protein